MSKPVVLLAGELSPAVVDALGAGVDLRTCDGTDREALLAAVADVDAVIFRSRTRIDADVIAAASRLKVLARAGVSLDNIDVKAATLAGVMVVNAPQANLVSTAEHVVGLLLAVARRIPAADGAVRRGEWSRDRFTGTELYDKTLGILGLGKVGGLVARRLQGFGMQVVAYDPYVQPGRAAQLGARLAPLATVLAEADVLSVHLPRTPETVGLVGEEQLAAAKPGVLVVNASRAGIVDDHALYLALKEGRVAGAGIDVLGPDRELRSPLFGLDNVVATPHLAANTVEAQEKAARAVARSVRLALAGELVPDAVNVQGGVIAEEVRPAVALTESLGRVFSALAGGVAAQLDVEVRGEIAEHDVKALQLAAVKGVFTDVVDEHVSYVNAPLLAAERGLAARLVNDPEVVEHRNLVTLRGTLADGREVCVSGTLGGSHKRDHLVEVEGFPVELELADHLIFLRYDDRPGVVGAVGVLLAEAGLNIAGMQVSRRSPGGRVLAAIAVDSPVPEQVLDRIAGAVGAVGAGEAHAVDLTSR